MANCLVEFSTLIIQGDLEGLLYYSPAVLA